MKQKDKFVPIEKMSKKQKKEYYSRQRKDWGGLSPVTRCPKDPKAYDRAKSKRDCRSRCGGPFHLHFSGLFHETE